MDASNQNFGRAYPAQRAVLPFDPAEADSPDAGRGWQPSARPISSTQRERVQKLQGILFQIEAHHANGMPVRKAIRRALRRWQGRHYSTGKPVHFSESRVASLFYLWRRDQNPAVLRNHYKPHATKMPGAVVIEFLQSCAKPYVYSMAAAYHLMAAHWRDGNDLPGVEDCPEHRECELPPFPFSISQLYRALSASQRRAIRDYHAAALRAFKARKAMQVLCSNN
jgi:hypothetical protein